MSFLYAVPGKDNNNVTWDHFKHAFDGQPQRGLDQRGLTDEKTAVLADHSVSTSKMRIAKEEQEWRRVQKDEGIYWIGYWKNDPPTPETLRRTRLLSGKEIKTRVGGWTVPTAISFHLVDGETQTIQHLERYVDFNDQGQKVYGDVVEQFEPLHDIAMAWLGQGDSFLSPDEVLEFASQVIGHNYRVAYEELCMLRAFTQDIAVDVMTTLVDTSDHNELRDAVVIEEGGSQKKRSPSEE